MSVITLSATKLADLIRKKEISAQEVVQQYFKQIENVNPKINAIVESKFDDALETAVMLDEKQTRGETLGPLHGVPFTVKDIFNVIDYKTTAGCTALKDNVATEDATFVKRLKAAGGIFIGKTNTPEFENSGDTFNDIYGKTKNPYDLNRSAGGSSGGCGAAVAASCAAFSIGADHGGSLRIPAHYNGITTIRSTVGRIPSTGVLYGLRTGLGARFNTEGPMARYVEDLELILNVIQGPDGIDPNAQKYAWSHPIDQSPKELKFAYFLEDGNVSVMEEVMQAVKNAAEALKDSGAKVEQDKPARIGEGFELYQQISGPNATMGFNALFEHYNIHTPSDMIKQQLKNFVPYLCDLPTYLQRWDQWDLFRSEILKFFEKYDAFICPVTASDALLLDTPMWYGHVNLLSFCWATSAAMLPAVVVRAGTSKAGLPIGVQIVTKPYNESIALAAAKQIENTLGGWKKPNL